LKNEPGGSCRRINEPEPNLSPFGFPDFDAACAEPFDQLRGTLLQQGITVSRMDLLVASVALVDKLTH